MNLTRLQLQWNKCQGEIWCPFLTVNLNHPNFSGIEGAYIIWHGGQSPWTVSVGSGGIADKLIALRSNPEILKYAYLGLFVTWARVPRQQQLGVERYLVETLNPRVSGSCPADSPIVVNLPW